MAIELHIGHVHTYAKDLDDLVAIFRLDPFIRQVFTDIEEPVVRVNTRDWVNKEEELIRKVKEAGDEK